MATPREIRRLAFQALYQLDARAGADADQVRVSLDPAEELTDVDRDRAMEIALAAWAVRAGADEEFRALAPAWPVHRQAAVDRAILRLAHFEMTSGRTPPKVAVNEAVELAKEFSTDRSPSFVNGLLDKVLKRVLGTPPAGGAPSPAVQLTSQPGAE